MAAVRRLGSPVVSSTPAAAWRLSLEGRKTGVDLLARPWILARSVVLRVAITDVKVDRYASAGVYAVGCHLETSDADDITRANEQLRSFCTAVKKAGMASHIHGIDDAETDAMAVEAVADYLSGEYIGPLAAEPITPHPFKPEDAAPERRRA